MDKIIDKLSTYNIFTNLLPGILYCYLADWLFGVPLLQKDLIVGAFLYYFCGMVISRVSSVVLEPLLKKARFVRFVEYKAYVSAAEKDGQIGLLLEVGNSYRSAAALLGCVLITGGWVALMSALPAIQPYARYVVLSALLTLFLFAYRKQAQYIAARVRIQSDGGASP